MKFDVKKNYYRSLNEMLKNNSINKLFEKNIKQLDEIYYSFKYYNNNNNECNFYVFNETINKEIFNYDKIDILVEVDKNLFEDFVDRQVIKDLNESINIYFKIEEDYYTYDNFWKKISLNTEGLVNINQYIEDYEF